ncbi:hypothetical protein ROJ8625_03083 [Roseivivax jejudonensis]|uniref:DUF4174 domain-containing protein n=1 Tax=Roseivivax jejudonensis TaxID=1529041 RepID=A0A1X6ZTR2_9RHOB|nr:DUF4174 domain-containing protein [Roseivivax jejudonensis]SLN60763.1 hypothetical protein ROJ8625_03083 [Roseivivax jejudonensis]
MRRLIASLSVAGAALAAPADADRGIMRTLSPDTDDLSAYRWENRPVLLFAPSPDDPEFRRQVATLEAAQPDVEDRDIVVLSDTDPQAGGALRARFAPDGFLFVLVGKDGGVKRTETAPVAAADLFGTIDAMPMRRREMSQ